jgi:hypothetical protein
VAGAEPANEGEGTGPRARGRRPALRRASSRAPAAIAAPATAPAAVAGHEARSVSQLESTATAAVTAAPSNGESQRRARTP